MSTTISKIMKKYKREYSIIETSGIDEATLLVETNIDMYDIFVAVGGDGTINEVSKGLINSRGGKLGIIPCGTGNDLSRTLGIPRDYDEAIKTIINGNTKTIEVGLINDKKFINIASAGFDGEVIRNHKKLNGRIKGKKSYVLTLIYTLMGYKNKNVEINIDGTIYKESMLMLAAGNGKYYGGGLNILPDAELNDGFIHICIVRDIGRLKGLIIFPKIYKGGHVKHTKYVIMLKGRNIQIKSNDKLCVNIDGEEYPEQNNVTITLSDDELQVIC